MDKNQKILDEVKKTISLLDNVRNIEPNPFLFTRIKSKLNAEVNNNKSASIEFVFKILQKFVFILLLLFNAFSVISYLNDGGEDTQTRQTYIKNIISEYSLATESDYEIYYENKD